MAFMAKETRQGSKGSSVAVNGAISDGPNAAHSGFRRTWLAAREHELLSYSGCCHNVLSVKKALTFNGYLKETPCPIDCGGRVGRGNFRFTGRGELLAYLSFARGVSPNS
jgi:hypothetical protein